LCCVYHLVIGTITPLTRTDTFNVQLILPKMSDPKDGNFGEYVTAALARPVLAADDHLTRLFNNERLSDATVQCGDKTYFVHKVVLCTRGKWFSKAFESGFKV